MIRLPTYAVALIWFRLVCYFHERTLLSSWYKIQITKLTVNTTVGGRVKLVGNLDQ
jgi:hypothetical protein